MTGYLDSIYEKDGRLILNRKIAESLGAKPVVGAVYEAIILARNQQIAEDEQHFQTHFDVNYIVHGHKQRVKMVMQEALTRALAEPDGPKS